MNFINLIKKISEQNPEKTAIVFKNQKISYSKLLKKVQQLSNFLENSFSPNIVTLISENSIDFVICYLSILNSGKIANLISPELSQKNILLQVESANSDLIICSKKFLKKIDRSKFNLPLLQLDLLQYDSQQFEKINEKSKGAYLIYTSGTTSEPKGVCITHDMINFTTKNIVKILKYTKNDIDFVPLPLFHSFGLGCLHTSLFVGSSLVLEENTNDLRNILLQLKKYHVTTFAAIPSTLTKFLQFPKNDLENYFSDLRLIITNSTSIPKNTVLQFKNILKNGSLATYYGLTEASRSTFMIFEKNIKRETSVGKTPPGVEIKIHNQKSSHNNEGEIWVKGSNVIKNYWNGLHENNFVDGWFRTGDIGYLDNENYLFLLGRKDDLINVGGEKVFPFEIEDVIKQIDGVADVVAFGIKHELFGQVIKTHIIKKKNFELDKSKILSHCIKNLEKFKIPTKIEFVNYIPKTEYGKVKRFMLK